MAIERALADQLAAFVQSSDQPTAMASAMLGAIMGAIGSLYGDEAAATMLYALADATATRASSARAAAGGDSAP